MVPRARAVPREQHLRVHDDARDRPRRHRARQLHRRAAAGAPHRLGAGAGRRRIRHRPRRRVFVAVPVPGVPGAQPPQRPHPARRWRSGVRAGRECTGDPADHRADGRRVPDRCPVVRRRRSRPRSADRGVLRPQRRSRDRRLAGRRVRARSRPRDEAQPGRAGDRIGGRRRGVSPSPRGKHDATGRSSPSLQSRSGRSSSVRWCPIRTRRRCGTGIPTSGCSGSRRAHRRPSASRNVRTAPVRCIWTVSIRQTTRHSWSATTA